VRERDSRLRPGPDRCARPAAARRRSGELVKINKGEGMRGIGFWSRIRTGARIPLQRGDVPANISRSTGEGGVRGVASRRPMSGPVRVSITPPTAPRDSGSVHASMRCNAADNPVETRWLAGAAGGHALPERREVVGCRNGGRSWHAGAAW
jgi:hypothetical protein